jgi:hypothetical protein
MRDNLADLALVYRQRWQQREQAMDAWRAQREHLQARIAQLGQQILDLEHELAQQQAEYIPLKLEVELAELETAILAALDEGQQHAAIHLQRSQQLITPADTDRIVAAHPEWAKMEISKQRIREDLRAERTTIEALTALGIEVVQNVKVRFKAGFLSHES